MTIFYFAYVSRFLETAEYFYLDRDEEGEKKAPGWLFLSAEISEDEEEDEGC